MNAVLYLPFLSGIGKRTGPFRQDRSQSGEAEMFLLVHISYVSYYLMKV